MNPDRPLQISVFEASMLQRLREGKSYNHGAQSRQRRSGRKRTLRALLAAGLIRPKPYCPTYLLTTAGHDVLNEWLEAARKERESAPDPLTTIRYNPSTYGDHDVESD